MKQLAASLFLILLGSLKLFAQDTIHLSIRKADSLFQSKNYYLLAASMNIEAQRAQIIQAKVYPNPIFTADINAYDPENNKAFHVGRTGQKLFQLEQLILLGGKRKSEIEIAKTNAGIAELEFQQLVRELKFRLHSDLYTIGQQDFLLKKYNKQLNFLDTLLKSYETQAQKGNIPLKEVVRLRGAYIQLNNDRAELYQQYIQTQTDLQILLQSNSIILPDTAESNLNQYLIPSSVSDIQSTALENLPELLVIKQNKVLAEQYLKYQKRMAIPDINVFAAYDQRSGAFNNQVNAGISIPLPVWNRNRGNIKTSQFQLKEAEYTLLAKENEIISRINNSYAYYVQTVSEYQKSTELYNDDFEKTVDGINLNFQKRNVSIIEFIDFFESYNDVLSELVRIKTQLVISAEQINLLTGKDIY
ncbi:TolC family protein [Fluviicola taffensis]|uniref:Outer membrane efflux protein n=1 Tax=Fluviicola taffensis (strain DSM 16823 / NCIMB 13979 / RW262) TaxID=755732 RepID=F2IB27_FLUTR|nr:TolC family protein [Fluviicola taffensis]AEA42110.1 outer membrane efflux protein [Fluviicola taffensis DSM 16823]